MRSRSLLVSHREFCQSVIINQRTISMILTSILLRLSVHVIEHARLTARPPLGFATENIAEELLVKG
jgi:hypothetical protein